MYVTYQNKICVPTTVLFENNIVESNSTYSQWVYRGHLNVVRRGGNGRVALVDAEQMRPDIKAKVVELFGDPKDAYKLKLTDYIEWDVEAEKFYREYRYNDDIPLPEDTQLQYTTEANILNAFKTLLNHVFANAKVKKGEVWKNINEAVKNLNKERYPHKLPGNVRSLQRKYKGYLQGSYRNLVHKNFGNEFTAKLTAEGKQWALARWCNQVNRCASLAQLHVEYNEEAIVRGWKYIKDEKTFYNFLYDEEVQASWWGHRYGTKAANEKFGFKHTTKLPQRRDSLWYSDGTKMNIFYNDENGKKQTAWVYEVMDAYSEVLLGYHIFKGAESFTNQYPAYKNAIQFAGHRPYEIRFDNGGGHKKLMASEFYNKLTRLAIRTQPHNGSSKSIESAFGRFQQQIMAKCWFFTGQNVTARKQASRANMEMINANVKNLPTFEEACDKYKQMREEWNNSKHHLTGLSRLETYYSSENEKAPAIDIWDMVNIFWLWHTKNGKQQPITYTPGGLSFKVGKQDYEYLVVDEKGLPDMDFIDKNTDKKFFVKYDPELMDEVYLYEKDHSGKRFVTSAKLKTVVHRAIQDQTDNDVHYLYDVDQAKKEQRIKRHELTEELLEDLGMAAWQQGLNSPKIVGLNTGKRKPNKKTSKTAATVEEDYDKQISNLTQNDISYDKW